MDWILAICMVSSLILGIINGLGKISNARSNPDIGCQPSNNLFTFLFADKYE